MSICRTSYVVPMCLRAAVTVMLQVAALQAAEFDKTTNLVQMRDGTKLATDVYLPEEGKRPCPAVFVRGPYGKSGAANFLSAALCPRGYALVMQDMRGRFASEGSDAVVFFNDGWGEQRDGHDSIKWIAEQPWSDGKVATWGGSALGITQNLLAVDAPPALKAQYVQVAFSNMYSQCTYQGGVWRKELLEPWLAINKFDPKSLETFLAHPRYDEFWAGVNAEAEADRAHAPAIFWGGWYDIFLDGTVKSFTSLNSKGKDPAKGNCRLILGPWAHGTFDELKYPAVANQPPAAEDAFRFFDYWVKGVDNGVPQDKLVHYYVMGDPTDPAAPGNVWRSVDAWPPAATSTPYYFQADGTLSTQAPAAEGKLDYRYDPKDPVPTVGGQNLSIPKGPMDQRKIEDRKDVLLFTTEALSEPLEVTGTLSAKLFISSDCPDTDFTVKLCDVYPDGRSMLVTDGILRARFRKSFEREEFLEPGQVYELTVDLWSTSLLFNKGHRIRVAVSSSNAPRFDPNPNTGHAFRADSETRVATNTLHLAPSRASHIVLPVHTEP